MSIEQSVIPLLQMVPSVTKDPSVSPVLQMVPYVLIIFIFYFVFFKPQKEQQKKKKETIEKLKKNDKVITAGGMHGTIAAVKEKTVVIRVDDNVKMEFDKESISTVETT